MTADRDQAADVPAIEPEAIEQYTEAVEAHDTPGEDDTE